MMNPQFRLILGALKRLLFRILPYSWLQKLQFWQLLPIADFDYRRKRVLLGLLAQFENQLQHPSWVKPTPTTRETIIISTCGDLPSIMMEALFAKALQQAGFRVVLLSNKTELATRFYRVLGLNDFVYWEDFFQKNLPQTQKRIKALQGQSVSDLLGIRYKGVQSGAHAVAMYIRNIRKGIITLDDSELSVIGSLITLCEDYTDASLRIINHIQPDKILMNERGYVVYGALFDCSINRGLDVLQWVGSHADNQILFKRYKSNTHGAHPASLSESTWQYVQTMQWGPKHIQRLEAELHEGYSKGTWFGEVGTQFNKQLYAAKSLIHELGLDLEKKTAVVFSHIFWDASFFYGQDLYRDYQEWFIETIRFAIQNPNLNWLVKVHPANITKNRRERVNSEIAEMTVIRDFIGELPEHIQLIPADTNISTFSLFNIMDYCLTVRGTVGIEAASLGIPVITAGTGRYSGLGFTVDSASIAEYTEKLLSLHTIEPMSPKSRERAQRYAYSVLLMRPFRLETVTMRYEHDEQATQVVDVNVVTVDDLVNSRDTQQFIKWVEDNTQEDYLETETIV
jgi:hypothetical protein